MNSVIVKGMAAAVVMAAAGRAAAIDKNWNVRSGNWNTGTNWFTNGVPGPADNVFIGNTAAAFNGVVTLNVDAAVTSLTITDGMMVRTVNNRLVTTGDTTISGRNQQNDVMWSSRVQVNDGPAASDFVTRAMTVSDGAGLDMEGGRAEFLGLLHIQDDATLYGSGEIRLHSNGPVALRRDGFMQAGVEGLVINQLGTGRIDLDGQAADALRDLSIATAMIDGSAFANLTINGDALTDAFDEQITLVEGGFLTMNLTQGWAMGPASTMRFTSFNNDPHVAEVNGSRLTFDGRIEMAGTCTAQFNCPVTLGAQWYGSVGSNDRLYFNNLTTISGGDGLQVGSGGQVAFNGATVVNGGTFWAAVDPDAVNPVAFNATTEWNGTVNLHGRAAMNNSATVTGTTVINADVFDMDGGLNNSAWAVSAPLTVNAERISRDGYFLGTFNVGPSLGARLTVNIESGIAWPMSGTMNLTGLGDLTVTRLTGTPMAMQGQLNVSGRVVTASILLQSSTVFASAASELRMTGTTQVEENATFSGGGTLHILPSGTVELFDGSNMGSSPLVNEGRMWVSDLPGSAVIPRLTQAATSRWDVQVAGNQAGELHDTLYVTGAGSVIDGDVEVELALHEGEQFVPSLGESFLILDTRQGYTGAFNNLPTSIVGSVVVEWAFRYTPTQVFVEVADVINRCPADFNNDGFVDFFDYDAYVLCFETGECPSGKTADFNGDEFVDFFDYDAYVLAFENGC